MFWKIQSLKYSINIYLVLSRKTLVESFSDTFNSIQRNLIIDSTVQLFPVNDECIPKKKKLLKKQAKLQEN